jgi:hypothetical protein
MRGLIMLLAAASLAGCATQNGNRYAEQLARLEADCQAREGIIRPTGRFTGRRRTSPA